MSKSWNIPGFDVYDPNLVFYAPLWRPDMVARGGSIKNGTGTMDVNPQALAVGANTITVTAAGTLIVAMPEGGTVASGTMTVTGSPVTVSAGIQTTITTTGAIGNITVTPNNIIRSKDRNNHALTVTGATWGYQGRTLNGSSDKIDIPTSAAFQDISVGAFTFWAWIKHSDASTGYDGILMVDLTTNGRGFILEMNNSSTSVGFLMRNTAGTTFFPEVAITDNTWTFLAGTFDLSQMILYKDGVAGTPTAFTGSRAAAASVAVTLGLGEAGGRNYGGIIGETGIISGSSTAQKIQQLRLSTKWRYN